MTVFGLPTRGNCAIYRLHGLHCWTLAINKGKSEDQGNALGESANMPPRRQRRLPPRMIESGELSSRGANEEEEATAATAVAAAVATTVDEQGEISEVSQETSCITLTNQLNLGNSRQEQV